MRDVDGPIREVDTSALPNPRGARRVQLFVASIPREVPVKPVASSLVRSVSMRAVCVAPALYSAVFGSAVLAAAALGCGDGSNDDCAGASCAPAAPSPVGTETPTPAPADPVAPAPAGTEAPGEGQSPDIPLAETPETPVAPPPAGPPAPPVIGDAQAILDGSVRFYGAQRSGDGANWLLGSQSCHMFDGETIQTDLTGGWYDAGDHLKVTLSIAYASYVMLKAYDAFPTAFPDNYGERYEGPNGV